MRTYQATLMGLVLWLASAVQAVETAPTRAETYGVGPILQVVIPSQLPDFLVPISSYGGVVSLPLYRNALQVQASYGAGDGVKLFLAESFFQLNISTPFLRPSLLAGVHYLAYGLESGASSYQKFGAITGVGLTLGLDDLLDLQMAMKLYLRSERMLSVSGSLIFRL